MSYLTVEEFTREKSFTGNSYLSKSWLGISVVGEIISETHCAFSMSTYESEPQYSTLFRSRVKILGLNRIFTMDGISSDRNLTGRWYLSENRWGKFDIMVEVSSTDIFNRPVVFTKATRKERDFIVSLHRTTFESLTKEQ